MENERDRSKVRVVEAWHDALDAGDAERVVALSHPDVEVVGPRGRSSGARLIRDWVDRAGVSIAPLRVFHKADTVVVEQAAEWRSGESGEVIGSQTVASVFVVSSGRVASVARYDDLAEALDTAELEHSDEILPEHR